MKSFGVCGREESCQIFGPSVQRSRGDVELGQQPGVALAVGHEPRGEGRTAQPLPHGVRGLDLVHALAEEAVSPPLLPHRARVSFLIR